MMNLFVIVTLGILLIAQSSARIHGPVTFATVDGVQDVLLEIPLPLTLAEAQANSSWAPHLGSLDCFPGVGIMMDLTLAYAPEKDEFGTTYSNVPTFVALYNANGHLAGYYHRSLINLHYPDHDTKGLRYWAEIPSNTGDAFDFPADSWVMSIHFEPSINVCNASLANPENMSYVGDVVLMNDPSYFTGVTRLNVPLNKTVARQAGLNYPPHGDQCLPGMGTHWFDPNAGEPIFPSWIVGYDAFGNIQFHELQLPIEMYDKEGQWDKILAGTIPGFNVDQWFRHIHLKPRETACPFDICDVGRWGVQDCAPNAICAFQPSLLPPYFQCICPQDGLHIRKNFGRGVDGCPRCPNGQKASLDGSTCVDACGEGFKTSADGLSCDDIDDCPGHACAGDELCVNLYGNPYACVYKQLPSSTQSFLTKVKAVLASNLTEILNINGVSVNSFVVTKTATLRLQLSTLSGVSASTVAQRFSAWSGVTVIAEINEEKLIASVSDPSSLTADVKETIIAKASPLVPLASLLLLAVLSSIQFAL